MLANNRFFGTTAATLVSGLAPSPNALPWHQALARSSSSFGRTAAVPRGYGAIGAAWPTRAGEIGADPDATITLTALPALVLAARQVAGDASIELTAAGDVQATAVVAGTATVSLAGTADIQAAAVVAGLAGFTLGAVGAVGALADVVGSASITLTASTTGAMGATARTAGVAHFSAAAEGNQLTEAGIVSAVWQAVAASNNAAGTMGAKLNAAGSGGVDLNALADAVLDAMNADPPGVDVKKMNGFGVVGDGSTGNKWRGAGV